MTAPPPAVALPPLAWRLLAFDALSPLELQRIHQARQQVFVVEQQCVFQDADAADERALHLACWSHTGELLAYARLLAPGAKFPDASIGRVLTTSAARGLGLGRALMVRAIADVQAAHPGQSITISAQQRLLHFYEGLRFRAIGPPYLEDGIWHIDMRWLP